MRAFGPRSRRMRRKRGAARIGCAQIFSPKPTAATCPECVISTPFELAATPARLSTKSATKNAKSGSERPHLGDARPAERCGAPNRIRQARGRPGLAFSSPRPWQVADANAIHAGQTICGAGKMRILFVGDVVGPAGREAVARHLPSLIADWRVDLAVVNGENAASSGFGLTEAIYDEIVAAGADAVTLGNHSWAQKEALTFIERAPRLIRPINYIQ